jgi:TrmH family RNA methyltransferase
MRPTSLRPIPSGVRPVELVRELRKREARDESSLYVFEGARFLVSAIDAGASIEGLVVCDRLLTSSIAQMLTRRLRQRGVPCDRVAPEVYGELSRLREGRGRGVMAIARQRWEPVPRLSRGDLWLAVGDVRSPGNLGSLLRTSLAVGAAGLFVLGDADPYDPACVRATMGALERLALVRTAAPELFACVHAAGGSILGATPDGSVDYRSARFREPTVIFLGSERSGLTVAARDRCDVLVRIPMVRSVDSLNLAVAGSILLYEAFDRRMPAHARDAAFARLRGGRARVPRQLSDLHRQG